MNSLAEIFDNKREEVASAKRARSLSEIREMAAMADETRGFLSALKGAKGPLALIAEVKKASPSKGLIRADFDPAEIAREYEAAGAHCLSVLTDVNYFQGSAENLIISRKSTQLPCLRKDFLDDPYQIYEARAWGADAILLIVAALDDSQLADLQALAWELKMDALVEVHDEAEADRALAVGAKLVGVNNRSLKDLSTDLSTSERILHMLVSSFPVAESALTTHADLVRMSDAGAKAVLIGTTFCAAPNIGAKVKEVMGW